MNGPTLIVLTLVILVVFLAVKYMQKLRAESKCTGT